MIKPRFIQAIGLLTMLMPLALYSQSGGEFLPPHRISIDPVTMVLYWNSPGQVVLDEDFEEAIFPPPGWQVTSSGKGWQRPDTVLFNHWKIPFSYSKYAISNDDSTYTSNNGSVDLLITPVLDLTAYDSLKLTFDSYFDGAYGQSAYVEYSINGGLSWTVLEEIKASLSWEIINIDLAGLAGLPGINHINFAFHSDDNGLNGSGWAVDNVVIASSPAVDQPVNYIVFFDNVPADTTTELSSFIPTIEYTYAEEHEAGVCACYPGGNSETISVPFVSKYLFPLYDLHMEYCGKYCFGLSWSGPYRPPACWPWELETFFETPDNWTEGGSDAFDDHIFIVYENMNGILKMDKEGNVVNLIIIPGVPPLTDITHGYGYFYGCNGTNTIYIIDYETLSLTGQFTAPVIAHGLAYSEMDEVFYANNISSDITVFDQEGTIYNTFPVGEFGNIHSLAYNDYSDDETDLYAISRDSTGALIVGYRSWAGLPSGFTLDVSNLAEGGIAGGVFIDYDGCSEDCVYLGGSLQNEVVFEYALGEQHCPGWTPPGLWGYYFYKDGVLFDSLEIMCDKYAYFIWYPDDTLPQSHEFSASVKYELEIFGLDDQIDFSQKAGPVNGSISYGYDLDFSETWSSQTFNFHKWDTTGNRWEINNMYGNPVPSACFRGINGTDPYSAILTSNMIKPGSSESCGVSLSFDLRVYDSSPTGNQLVGLELWDSGTREWNLLKEYRNDTVWTGFYHENIDLSDKVRGRHFMIRFNAHGDNPSDVMFWSLDNILLECSCPPPKELQATFDQDTENIELSWNSPFPEKEQWVYWDDSLHHASVGLGTDPDTWSDIAAKWEPGMLEGLQGGQLEKIALIPSDPETHYILKVWSGYGAEIVLYEQAIANLEMDQWNTIQLDEPVILVDQGDLWIGYSFRTKGQNPVSLDAGPAAEGSGNLCRIGSGNWTTLQEFNPEFTGNINVRGYLRFPEVGAVGYRLYKSLDSGPFQLLAELENPEYIDSEIEANIMHCYKTKAICFVSPDTLSSDFSSEDCVLPVFINDNPAGYPGLQIFPNPSEGKVYFITPESIQEVEIYDLTGRSARSFNNFETETMIDLTSLKPGVYIIISRGKQSVFYNKVVISR